MERSNDWRLFEYLFYWCGLHNMMDYLGLLSLLIPRLYLFLLWASS